MSNRVKAQELVYGRTLGQINVPIQVDENGVVQTNGGGGGGWSGTNVVVGQSPTFATVGVTSAQILAADSSRMGLFLTNTSSNFISLGFDGNAAVLNSGLTLTPYGVLELQPAMITRGAITAIASGASSNLGIQVFH